MKVEGKKQRAKFNCLLFAAEGILPFANCIFEKSLTYFWRLPNGELKSRRKDNLLNRIGIYEELLWYDIANFCLFKKSRCLAVCTRTKW